MSFLLDALGKADHDRRRSEVPELRTYNPARRSPLRGLLRGLTWLSLLVFTFALGYFLRPYLDTTFFNHGVASEGKLTEQMVSKPEDKAISVTPVQTKALALENVPQESGADHTAYELEVISYSDSPPARFAMINGVMLYEGEKLGSGEVLLMIEPDAVVLDKAGTQIRLEM
jgi:hypothetical protein